MLLDAGVNVETELNHKTVPIPVVESDNETAKLDQDPLPEEVVYDLDQRQVVFDDRCTNRTNGVSQRDILADTYSLLDNVSKMLK